jgi:hypothetical protein
MVWCKAAFALLSLGDVATRVASVVPIEFNSSKTVILNAVADGRVLRNPEDDDSLSKNYDDMQFVSGTMNELIGHVFMAMCDFSFENPGRIVEIDPDLGYPSSFVEQSSLPGCPVGMASDVVTGDMYASVYVSDNFRGTVAASEIVKISSTGAVTSFSRRVEGCTNPTNPGWPNFNAVPGDLGCFSFLTKMVRSCRTGALYVYQDNYIFGEPKGFILKVSSDGATSEVYKIIHDCWIGVGADGSSCTNQDEVSRIVGMTIDCETDIIYATRKIGAGSRSDVLVITPESVVSLASEYEGASFFEARGVAFHRLSQSLLVAEEGTSLTNNVGHRVLQINLKGDVSLFAISSRLLRPEVVVVRNNVDARLQFLQADDNGDGHLRGASAVLSDEGVCVCYPYRVRDRVAFLRACHFFENLPCRAVCGACCVAL